MLQTFWSPSSSSSKTSGDQDVSSQQSTSVGGMAINPQSQSTFTTAFLAITFSWLIVSLWQRVIDNFTFGTLGLNENSTFHALIVAASITAMFIITVWIIDVYDLVPGGIEKDTVPGSDGQPSTPTAPPNTTPISVSSSPSRVQSSPVSSLPIRASSFHTPPDQISSKQIPRNDSSFDFLNTDTKRGNTNSGKPRRSAHKSSHRYYDN